MKFLDILRNTIYKELGVDITETKSDRLHADAIKIFSHIAYAKGYTLHQIGAYTNRDHSTIVCAKKTFKDLYGYDRNFILQANKIIGAMDEVAFFESVGLLSY